MNPDLALSLSQTEQMAPSAKRARPEDKELFSAFLEPAALPSQVLPVFGVVATCPFQAQKACMAAVAALLHPGLAPLLAATEVGVSQCCLSYQLCSTHWCAWHAGPATSQAGWKRSDAAAARNQHTDCRWPAVAKRCLGS